MFKKKMEVVELNKEKEKIVLEEKHSLLILFFKEHRFLILLALFLTALITFIIGSFLLIKNFQVNEEPTIKEAHLHSNLTDYNHNVYTGLPITSTSAQDKFLNSGDFKAKGEVLTVKVVESNNYVIKFYSDGTALRIIKKGNSITRINPLPNGEYGINTEGVTNINAITKDIKITSTQTYPFGDVTYFSDGSAEITNSKINMFVRNGEDINEKYIADHKVSYLKESKTINNNKLNYYYDGTVEILIDNQSYIIRNENDIDINNGTINFKNNNAYQIYKTINLSDGLIIDYYQDGGAIIKDGTRTISVRKSNSIIIKDNKIYEIVDNIYVEECYNLDNITYYTNGGAVVDYNNKTYYIDENSNILYQDNKISDIRNNKEELTKKTNNFNEDIKIFEKTAVIKTNEYIAILPKEGLLYDKEGKIKELTIDDLNTEQNEFSITNNTNTKLNYRIVIKKSDRTNLDIQYIRYQLQAGDIYVAPSKLDEKIWKKDQVYTIFNTTGENYILLENTIEPFETKNIKLMLWTDYDTIPNSMQDKYFYGTIKVYAWSEK